MAVKTTTGYSFPTVPAKYDSTDKTFLGAIRKLFDTLFSFKDKATKDITKAKKDITNAPAVAYDKLYPVGIVVWTDTNKPPLWPVGSGDWTGMGTVTTSGNKTLYAYKRRA